MMIRRLWNHLIGEDLAVRRAFPSTVRRRIAACIREQETRHLGELRFVIEGGLPPRAVLSGMTSRQRALAIFAQMGVWDTEANNGVLIYVLLADRAVEIVADRGINRKVASQAWESICGEMQRCFAQRRFEEGAVAGLVAISDLLVMHYPAVSGGSNPDELPNDPHLL